MPRYEVQGRVKSEATDGKWSRWYPLSSFVTAGAASRFLRQVQLREVQSGRTVTAEAGCNFRVEDAKMTCEYRLALREQDPPRLGGMVRFSDGCVGFTPDADGTALLIWDGRSYVFNVHDVTGLSFTPLDASTEATVRAAMSMMALLVK